MPIKKPYYCGRCNSRFWIRTKYCSRCGAFTSMPVYVAMPGALEAEAEAVANGSVAKMWLLILLGFVLFFSIIAFRAAGLRDGAAEGAAGGEQPGGGAVEEMVEVRAGRQIMCDPCGALIEDRTGTLKVQKSQAAKYSVQVERTSDCNACDAGPAAEPSEDYYYGYEPERRVDTPQPGMAKKLVLKLWGDPIKVEFRKRAGQIVERWYFGDPLFRIGSNNRYVEFDESGSVVFVRGMSGLGR